MFKVCITDVKEKNEKYVEVLLLKNSSSLYTNTSKLYCFHFILRK